MAKSTGLNTKSKQGLEVKQMVAKRLKALSLFVKYQDYDVVAVKLGIDSETAERWIMEFKDEDWSNIVDTAMMVTSKKAIEILLKVLDAMNDEEKIATASLSQLATVAGILTDKINIMSGRPTSVSKKLASVDVQAFEKIKKGFKK